MLLRSSSNSSNLSIFKLQGVVSHWRYSEINSLSVLTGFECAKKNTRYLVLFFIQNWGGGSTHMCTLNRIKPLISAHVIKNNQIYFPEINPVLRLSLLKDGSRDAHSLIECESWSNWALQQQWLIPDIAKTCLFSPNCLNTYLQCQWYRSKNYSTFHRFF